MQDNTLQSDEPRRTLIPQFSLRWLLGLTTVVAVFFSIMALGIQGHAWAAAVSVAVVSMIILAGVCALGFGAVWGFASFFGDTRNRPGKSPFAEPILAHDASTNDASTNDASTNDASTNDASTSNEGSVLATLEEESEEESAPGNPFETRSTENDDPPHGGPRE